MVHEAPASISGLRSLEEVERDHVLAAWQASGEDKQLAADALGLTPRTLWSRLKKFGVVE